MENNIVYLNGEYIREDEAKISIYDRGFMWGDCVYEHTRTFQHQIFKLEEHIARLFCSLRYVDIDIGMTEQQLCDISLEVIRRNEPRIGPDDDFVQVHRISRGVGFGPMKGKKPTIAISCISPVIAGVRAAAKFYTEGCRVITASTRRTHLQYLDPKGKLCNKLNHIMAELQVRAMDPEAYVLMLDANGYLCECTSQNILLVKDGKLFSPERDNILGGITRAVIMNELVKKLGIECFETNLSLYDAYNADEIFITATSFIILPVAKLDNRPVGKSVPGSVTKKLTDAWSEMVGVDIIEQGLKLSGVKIAT